MPVRRKKPCWHPSISELDRGAGDRSDENNRLACHFSPMFGLLRWELAKISFASGAVAATTKESRTT
jgi:hypothetical protein